MGNALMGEGPFIIVEKGIDMSHKSAKKRKYFFKIRGGRGGGERAKILLLKKCSITISHFAIFYAIFYHI